MFFQCNIVLIWFQEMIYMCYDNYMHLNELKLVRMTKAINTLIENISQRRFPVEKIILFGSTARDELNEYSDLDICILNEDELTMRQTREIEQYFYDTLQDEMPVNFIYCNHETLMNGKYVFESIRKEGLILYA